MENTEKKALLEAAAKVKGIPQKLIDGYAITSHFVLEHAVIELSNEWADLREFALTGFIKKKDPEAEKLAKQAAIKSVMKDEVDKYLGNDQPVKAAEPISDLQEYANKLVNE